MSTADTAWLGLFLMGAGGAAGALCRAAAGRLLRCAFFPWATLLVNGIGSFTLAALHGLDAAPHSALGLLLGAGFCGAFTTFSTFILETVLLFRAGLRLMAFLNLIATIGLCLLATSAGLCLNT